jgi:hypothetical protein
MRPFVIDANLVVGLTGGFFAGAGVMFIICLVVFGWLLNHKNESEEKDKRLHPPAL